MFFSTMKQRQQPTPTTTPEVLLQQAEAKEKAAGKDAEKLQAAIKAYEQVAKRYPKTEYAAQALLRKGIIQETKLHEIGQVGGRQSRHRQGALTTYTALVREFPPEKSEAGREAKARLVRLERVIDKQNSTHILYKVMDVLVAATGRHAKYSYALALVVVTILFKVLTTPLSHLQFKYMKEMQKLQPLVKQLQEKYKGNQQEIGRKLMALYKEHGVNPFSSCLPILVQLPVLWLLYWMVRLYQFQFAKGEFLWIGSSLANKFPAIVGSNLAEMDVPLLLIYAFSMYISQKLTIVDPSQAEQQKIMAYTMPILFTWMFWRWAFPSAFMLYWLLFNIFSTTQQYLILRQPAGPSGPTGGEEAGPPAEPPRRPSKSPGKAKRRKKRFDSFKFPRPLWRPIPSG